MNRTLLTLIALSSAGAFAAEPPVSRLPETTTLGFLDSMDHERPIGVTQRPEWTSARRFPSTRVYIQKEPWEVGVESWWRIKHNRDGSVSHRLLEEVGIGLPGRIQLDIYNEIDGDGNGDFHYQSLNIEARWALANWGKIPGNPTIYGEYKIADSEWGPDVYELKLLLGDQLAPNLHWALNFVWEAETGGDRTQEFQTTGGLSYSLLGGRLGLGVEALYDHETIRNERGNPSHMFNIGPSIQYRVNERFHVNLTCLFGCNQDSPRQIGFLVLGYEFGKIGGSSGERYVPVSGLRN